VNELIMTQEDSLFWSGKLLTDEVVIANIPSATALEVIQQASIKWGCGNFVVTREYKEKLND